MLHGHVAIHEDCENLCSIYPKGVLSNVLVAKEKNYSVGNWIDGELRDAEQVFDTTTTVYKFDSRAGYARQCVTGV